MSHRTNGFEWARACPDSSPFALRTPRSNSLAMLFIQSDHGRLLLYPYNERGAVQLLPEIGEPPYRFPPAEPAAAVSAATGVAPLARPFSARRNRRAARSSHLLAARNLGKGSLGGRNQRKPNPAVR